MSERRQLADGKKIWVIKAGFPNEPVKKCWSEYSFSNSLKKYLERLGYYVVIESWEEWENDEEADVIMLLRGHEAYFPDRRNKDCVYIMWNLSHPDMITEEEYNAYDLVCIGGDRYGNELKEKLKVPVQILPICADTEIFTPDTDPYGEKEYDWVFVGNSRYAKRKSVVWSLRNNIPLKIWGNGWEKVLPESMPHVVAENLPNDDLPDLYHNSKVTVDDHYEDMLEKGFINTRIMEALACGLPVISDYSDTLEDMFGDAILYYRDEKEFVEQVRYIEENYRVVKERVLNLYPIIRDNYSFESNARKLIKFSEEIREAKMSGTICSMSWEAPVEEGSKNVAVSVVMPVYNAEKHLRECLDSLLWQTLREIEIICVDDGSKDKSVSILGAYGQKDGRIRILRQKHLGAGEARNLGLMQARGTYVVFLDADDIFKEDMLEKVASKGEKTSADVIIFGAKRYDDRTGKVMETPWYLRREMLPDKEVFSRKDLNGQLFSITIPTPWTKAFRREFVLQEKLRFQNLKNSNDVYFVFMALAIAEKLSTVKEDLVLYRVFQRGSLQNQKTRNPLCFLEAYEAVYDELNRRGIYEEVALGFANSVISGCIHNLNTVQKEAREEIEEVLCSERFTRMGLLNYPNENYLVPQYKNQMAGFPYARELRRKMEEKGMLEELIVQGAYGGEKKVSVIIPVYNTRKYLEACMDSIVNQSLREIEILCVNDGSTDRSLEMLCEYAKKDDRISVYSQENCGLSVTRNRGLQHASGKYVYFMDSDDALAENALECLYESCEEERLDALYFDALAVYENEEIKKENPNYDKYYLREGQYPKECSGREMFMLMRGAGEYRVNMGIQFFRRDYLEEENLRFQPGILHEDNDFTFQAMLLAKRAGYVGETFFHRRIRGQSIMTEKVGVHHVYGYFKSFLKMLDFVEKLDFPEEMEELLYSTVDNVLNCAKKVYSELSDDEKYAFTKLKEKERILFRLFIEKDAETVAKLYRTYAEKSEINRKLQITYGEKYERGLEIKRLKRQIADIKKSETYRLARVIGSPIRLLRRLWKIVQG